MAGTRWVQTQLLQKYRDAHLRVYAVWFNMLPKDSRSKWPANLLTDRRVIHRWDEPRAVGTWYGQRTSSMTLQLTPDSNWNGGDILWDAFLLYGADARWDDEPTGLIHWGRTIVAARTTLEADFETMFKPRPDTARWQLIRHGGHAHAASVREWISTREETR